MNPPTAKLAHIRIVEGWRDRRIGYRPQKTYTVCGAPCTDRDCLLKDVRSAARSDKLEEYFANWLTCPACQEWFRKGYHQIKSLECTCDVPGIRQCDVHGPTE